MILPDVNVLLYAFRPDSQDHRAYRKWVESVVNGQAAYGMSPQVLASLIRIATHPRIFAPPSTLAEATAFASVLMDQPHCQIVQPGPRHWTIYCDLCRRANAIGNLTQDAWLAAIAIESGCEWITTDRDFSRFPGLRWRAPF
ncbi:MAG TPA: type II toxin-antitoxin system VapC family toxin [Bryobacteraceae bacterium]|nr:type II toxin-antitoxin system VapC family toxin [Bryobacteraceae bacterium]